MPTPAPLPSGPGSEFTRWIPADFSVPAFAGELAPAYSLRANGAEAVEMTFYDTFEWSVWHRGLLLAESRGDLRLLRRETGWIGESVAALPLAAPAPTFTWDLPASTLRAELAPLLRLRGLAPVARIRVERQRYDVLDPSRKTVCRLQVEALFPGQPGAPAFFHLVQLRPLRGYEADAAEVDARLPRPEAETGEGGPLAQYFREHGNAPRRYTLRPDFALTPDLPAREAVRVIIHRMLAIARENEPGIIADLDTEFLHDYRICLRKIRSVLSLVKGVFPDDIAAGLKAAFSRLAGATNRLRDLDVCLLSRADYSALLPAGMRPPLETLFADFSRDRAAQHAAVAAHLRSPGYQEEIARLAGFFSAPDSLPPSAASAQALGPLIARRIHRSYRKIRRVERALVHDTPDDAVHQLRIHGKKLRYLLEFFRELFPGDETAPLEKRLRRLQDRLGRFNDYSVQQKSLLDHGRACRAETGLAFSIGGLVAVLNGRQQRERAAIHESLEVFCSQPVASAFNAIFRPAEPCPAAEDAPIP